MKRLIAGLLAAAFLPNGPVLADSIGYGFDSSELDSTGADSVVLVHGLGRTSRSMRLIESRLTRLGYQTHNIDYPSTLGSSETSLAHLEEAYLDCCAGSRRVHFVTHSLGGILTRALIAEVRPDNLGRVVMLAPPNQGTEIVDRLHSNRLLLAAFGPTVTELGTASGSLPNRLGPADFELGIIAGNRSINPLGSALIEGVDDGAVSIENARLDGMNDFIVVRGNHSFIMRNKAAISEVIHFLEFGRFSHSELFAQDLD